MPSASAGVSPSGGKQEVGFFDPTVDYSKAKNYKVAYLYSGTSALYDMFSKAFAKWAQRMNCTYNDYSTTDADQFVNTIQTYRDQGMQVSCSTPIPPSILAAPIFWQS